MEARRKKWNYLKGLIGQHWMDAHLCYLCPWRRRGHGWCKNSWRNNGWKPYPTWGNKLTSWSGKPRQLEQKINPKWPNLWHMISKMLKVIAKKKISKAERKRQLITYMRTPIRLPADILAEILQARMEEHGVCKVLKRKKKKNPAKSILPGR